MYDGCTATAEAMMMAVSNAKKRNKVLVSETVNPFVLRVVNTYAKFHGLDVERIEAENGVTANNIIVRLGKASSTAISFDIEREVRNKPVIGNDPGTGDPIYGPETITWVPVETVSLAPGETAKEVDITDPHKYEVGEAIRINLTTITDEPENLTAVITFDEIV